MERFEEPHLQVVHPNNSFTVAWIASIAWRADTGRPILILPDTARETSVEAKWAVETDDATVI
jgi:hypothetical protein